MKTHPVETMEVSFDGRIAMLIHEAVVPVAYYDSVGVLTCYVGHTAAAGRPLPTSVPMAMPDTPEALDAALRVALQVFDADLEVYAEGVRRALRGMLVTQAQFDAAVDFHFNTGKIASAEWVKSWRRGDLAKAAREIMNFSKPKEIIERRKASQRLFRDGVYATGKINVWGTNGAGRISWKKPLRQLTPNDIRKIMAPGEPVPVDLPVVWPTIRRNSPHKKTVQVWQEWLTLCGYPIGVADGIFGKLTDAQTRAYQRDHGLDPDGIVGPKSWAKAMENTNA